MSAASGRGIVVGSVCVYGCWAAGRAPRPRWSAGGWEVGERSRWLGDLRAASGDARGVSVEGEVCVGRGRVQRARGVRVAE